MAVEVLENALACTDRSGKQHQVIPDKIVGTYLHTYPGSEQSMLKILLLGGWYIDLPDNTVVGNKETQRVVSAFAKPDWRKSLRDHYVKVIRRRVPQNKGYIPLGVEVVLQFPSMRIPASALVDSVSYHGVKVSDARVLGWEQLALDDLAVVADAV